MQETKTKTKWVEPPTPKPLATVEKFTVANFQKCEVVKVHLKVKPQLPGDWKAAWKLIKRELKGALKEALKGKE